MSSDKTVLVIDTAMAGCGVAVFDASKDAVFDAYNDEAHQQAQRLIPMVQGVLSDAGIGFDDLSDVIVCNGPGTFTGIRIGLSAAKTFGLTMGVSVWGITSLQALALCAVDGGVDRDMLGIVETRRQDFYIQEFDAHGVSKEDARSVMADDIDVGGRVLIGDAVQRFDADGQHEDANIQRIDVGVVARNFVSSVDVFTQDVQPIYLRAPDVSQPKNKPRVLASK